MHDTARIREPLKKSNAPSFCRKGVYRRDLHHHRAVLLVVVWNSGVVRDSGWVVVACQALHNHWPGGVTAHNFDKGSLKRGPLRGSYPY